MKTKNAALLRKWKNILDVPGQPRMTGTQRNLAVALLENIQGSNGFRSKDAIKLLTEAPFTAAADGINGGLSVLTQMNPSSPAPTGNIGDGTQVSGYDAITIGMIRRMMPQLIALDMCGVQPLTGPAGSVFATRWVDELGNEWLNPKNPRSNTIEPLSVNANNSNPALTAAGEVATANPTWKEVILRVARTTAIAETRLFRAQMTDEVLTDIQGLHGLDGLSEFSAAMGMVALHTINRELTDMVKAAAIVDGTMALGTFQDAEYHKFFYRLDVMAGKIAEDTGRARGNFVMVSRNVGAYILSWMVGHHTLEVAMDKLDERGSSVTHAYLGRLQNGMKVFVDYTAPSDYVVVGQKGASEYDAGIFFAPYTLGEQPSYTRDSGTMQPILGCRARYAFIANPNAVAFDATLNGNVLNGGTNRYYRKMTVSGLSDNPA